jgi:spectinomycin phosphotransferase
MLEKPNIADSIIVACLQNDYGLDINTIEFLPLGADRNTAVYRAVTDADVPYFVKLRRGDFDEMTIIVPKFFHDQGLQRVIAPLVTQSQQLWASLDDFTLFVFPFIDGLDAYNIDLSDQHWIEIGETLKAMHSTEIPSDLAEHILHETYSDEWRTKVKKYQVLIQEKTFDDPIASELADFLKGQQNIIGELVGRAESCVTALQTQSNSFVLCHADLHAGNVFITHDNLYIVDWDTMILAPKERDLMYAGGGQFMNKRSPKQEETLFYQGYGQTQIDPIALAYYRYERIVQDIAEYCEHVLLNDNNSEDRQFGARQMMSQFQPDSVIDIAFKTDTNSYYLL